MVYSLFQMESRFSSFFLKDPIFFSLFLYTFPDVFAELDGDKTQERLDRLSRMTDIEDLREPLDHPFAPLCIKVCTIIIIITSFICACNSCNSFQTRILATTSMHNKLMRLKLWMMHGIRWNKQNATSALMKHMAI